MKYGRNDAKAYSRETMKGVWAAALTPYTQDLRIDEKGFTSNLDHWKNDLGIDGVFIAGKQGEFFAMSVPERKRTFEVAVEAAKKNGLQTIMSCSDQNMDVVIDLAKHAEAVGADYIVVHAPVLHFFKAQEQTLYEYYKYIGEQVNIGIAMWSHPDSGYLMSPELCTKIADLPTIVAIKYSVPREMYTKLTRMAGDKLIVSTASEEEWLDNIIELDWKLYLCSNPPYLFQTAIDKRIREYSDLAFNGDFAAARRVRDSLNPVREAFRKTKPPEKGHAHAKYWQELLGQAAGPVRRPMLPLTDAEKAAIRTALAGCGLKLANTVKSSAA